MSEIIEFNKSDDALFLVAKERSQRGNFVGALNILLDLEQKEYSNVDLYGELALTYSMVPLYSTSCYYWFKYLALTKCKPNSGYQANKRLGYNLFRMGNHPLGALYYERSLDSEYEADVEDLLPNDELYDEYIEDDIGLNNSDYFYLVYKLPKNSNFKIIDKLVGDGKMHDAMQLLLSVDESSDKYVDAQIRYATCLFINKQLQEAIDCLSELQKKYPQDEYVLETLVSSIFASSNHEKIEPLLPFIDNIEPISVSLCYNVANYYCHIENYEKAMSLLYKALEIDKVDPDVHYFLALILFNLGKHEEALKHFVFCHRIYRDPVIDFYYDYCQNVVEGKESPKVLPYSRDIPEEDALFFKIDMANVIAQGKKRTVTFDSQRLILIAKYLIAIGSDYVEPYLSVLAHMKDSKVRKFILSTLYSLGINEKIKQTLIERLIYTGFSNTLYFTYGGVFMTSKIYKPTFSKQKKKLFNEAYAYAVSHIIAIENDNILDLSDGATKLYMKLEMNNKLEELENDKNALAVAMVINSSLEISKKKTMLISFFNADKEKVDAIFQLIKGRKKKNEDS